MLYHEIILGKQPNLPALIFHDRVTTFGDLSKKVELWSGVLQKKGVVKGDRVGIYSKNSDNYVVAYLAIIKSGGVVVPINYQLTSKEVAFIVKDTEMKMMFVKEHKALDGALADLAVHHPLMQILFEQMENESTAIFREVEMSENENCTIIYTSGTTGKPKGAMLSHKNLIANMLSSQKIVHCTENDKNITVLPMYHAFAWTASVSLALWGGGTNIIQENFVPGEVIQVLSRYRVTCFYGVPAMLALLIKGVSADIMAKLRVVVTGGAPLPRAVIDAFFAKFHVLPQEGYGLSEASPVCAVNPTGKVKEGSIGKELPDVELKLVDQNDVDILQEGEVGELCVRGENVMIGYFNAPKETAKVLRNGWLHTGDLAYRDSDGYYFVVDRLKDLIISAGENIYPREIEEELMFHPDVAEASVIGVPDKLRGQCACAYIVLRPGSEIDKRSVRKYLLGRIATYKVPKEVVFADSLPRNSSGKILKKALRERALVDLNLNR